MPEGQGAQEGGLPPNRGASVPDLEAIGPNSLSQRAWQAARGIDRAKQVRITKLSHMRYQHPDLDVITTFLKDFGLTLIKQTATERWFSGYGPDHYVYYARQGAKAAYLGGTFEVESAAELDKITRVPGLTVTSAGIEDLAGTAAPGGGKFLSITDPEGFPLNFIAEQTPVPAAAKDETAPPEALVINYETEKPRKRAFHRFVPGPASVYKLGHFGLCVDNFPAQLDWYTRHFNIVPSDIQYVATTEADYDPAAVTTSLPPTSKTAEPVPPYRREVAIFAHIDRGQELVDHHTIFLSLLRPGVARHVHHASFEVHDFDTQALGHQWLKQKGYESEWGIGRHILGSQIFDYWWDPNKFMVEHYADGDLVNEDTPVGYCTAGPETLFIWGPEVPEAFLD